MPDWTYHPLFKPLLFRLRPEASRRLTLAALALQGSVGPGRTLFRWFARTRDEKTLEKKLFGARFPAPIGLGPGIDLDGRAAAVLPLLSFGFLTLGPAGADAEPDRLETEPLRLEASRAIVSSLRAGAPSAKEIAARVKALPDAKRCPIGLALRGVDLARAIEDAEDGLDFFTLPFDSSKDLEALRALRARTRRPLLLRLSPGLSEDALFAATDNAKTAGLDGLVAVSGEPCALIPEGELERPGLLAESLRTTALIAHRYGDALPVLAAGGVYAPEDVQALLDAGAKLVQIGGGLVYAGPGFPARVIDALASPKPALEAPPTLVTKPRPLGWGPLCVALTGAILTASGLFALVLAATVKLLPYDVQYLGMSMEDLCRRNACRVVHFMAHDRVSFGGSIISIGILYIWLALRPLRRGEPWAFWTLLFSGILGFGSFLTYLGYGYLDVWHGLATLALIPVFGFGLLRSYAGLEGDKGVAAVLRKGVHAWLWSPGGMGRASLTFSAFGMISGGIVIMCVGMTRVFVPQDLEFIGATAAELHALNPRLVPLIAHDRAGFGGGLASTGITVMMILLYGLKPGERSLWWALLASGVIGFGCAIGVHPIVGYLSFVHLAPAYAGAASFLVACYLLWEPLVRSASSSRFSDV